MTLAGSLVCLLGVVLAPYGAAPFMLCISLGFALLLSNTSAIGVATMACVAPETRPFAIGLNTLMLHALGVFSDRPEGWRVANALSLLSLASSYIVNLASLPTHFSSFRR